MGISLGVDVGSTTAKVVALDDDGVVRWSCIARHHGRPRAVAAELLGDARARFTDARVGYTGSTGLAIAENAFAIHETHAVAAAVRSRVPRARTVVELGGQDAKILWLDSHGDDVQMNDRCAAGTGATLDRVARRLGLLAEDVHAAELRTDLSINARCGVFAETDVVNLVQRGVAARDAFGALAHSVVLQNLTVLARARALAPPVLLLGGPHAHVPALVEAWKVCLAQCWHDRGIECGDVIVPDRAELFAAIGAALGARSGRPASPVIRSAAARPPPLPALDPKRDRPTPAAPRPIAPPAEGSCLGVDIGSTSTKAVYVDPSGAIVASACADTAGDPVAATRTVLEGVARDLERDAHRGANVRSMGVTGYGAPLLAPLLDADAELVETIAHAKSASFVAPDADVVVDIGGTDVKVLRLRRGDVVDFFLSNQCAAGHGAFLAALAADLGIDVETLSRRALAATQAPNVTVGCAVFMDSDRVALQREGYGVDTIAAAMAWGVVRNVWEVVVPRAPAELGRRFLLTGGTHRNAAVACAHARYLRDRVPGAIVEIHPHPELSGAFGAALAARERCTSRRLRSAGDFAPRALDPAHVTLRTGDETRCTRCVVRCNRTILSLRGDADGPRTVVVGHTCERGADIESPGRRSRRHATDLFDLESRLLFRPLLRLPADVCVRRSAPTFAIPRALGAYRCAPLLLHYLRAAGVPDRHVTWSPVTSRELLERARFGANDPCFPAKIAPAHVSWLAKASRSRRFDYLLFPSVTHAAIDVRGVRDSASCPIVAASPFTARAAVDDELPAGTEWLTPELCLSDRATLSAQLFESLGVVLELDRGGHELAFEHALAAQRRFRERMTTLGRRVIDESRAKRKVAAVVLARPYHVDPGVQHAISTELAARGIPVLGLCALPRTASGALDLGDVFPRGTNSGCAEKIWGARVVSTDPNLVAVDLSSFRCGQDASIFGLVSELLDPGGKPVLRAHDLDESRPSVSLRMRVDTFVAAVRTYEATALRGATEGEHAL